MITSSPNGNSVHSAEVLDLRDLELSAQLTLSLAEKSGIENIQRAARELMIRIAVHTDGHVLNGARTPIEPATETTELITESHVETSHEEITEKTGVAADEENESSDEQTQRDQRLMQWAKRHNVFGFTPYRVQGTINKDFINQAREWAARKIKQPINDIIPKQIGFLILKNLSYAFDPSKHGESFTAFFDKHFEAALNLCMSESSVKSIPLHPTFESATAFVNSLQVAEASESTSIASVETITRNPIVEKTVTILTDENASVTPEKEPTPPTSNPVVTVEAQQPSDLLPPATPARSAADIEQGRQANVLMYIRENVPGADQVWDSEGTEYIAALERMFEMHTQEMQLHAQTILSTGNNVTIVASAALNAALKDVFMKAVASFNPSIQNDSQDQFKNHFIACITSGIKNVYAEHNQSPEDARKKRVINYLKTHVEDVGTTIEIDQQVFESAVITLCATSVDQMQNYAIKVLKSQHNIQKAKIGAVRRALEELCRNKAFPTFDPEDATGDRFRGHFTKVVDDHILDAYEKHKHV